MRFIKVAVDSDLIFMKHFKTLLSENVTNDFGI